VKTAWSCGISPVCGHDHSQRSRHLIQTLADLLHDRPRTVQRGGRNARHCDPACVRPRPRVRARAPARCVDRAFMSAVSIRPRRAWSPARHAAEAGVQTRASWLTAGLVPGDLAVPERLHPVASTATVTTQPIAAPAPRAELTKSRYSATQSFAMRRCNGRSAWSSSQTRSWMALNPREPESRP
jgi:hypothetical protein